MAYVSLILFDAFEYNHLYRIKCNKETSLISDRVHFYYHDFSQVEPNINGYSTNDSYQ